MILSKLINHDGGLHDFLWFVLISKQTAHFIGNCRICDDQIAALLQFLLFNLGISLEHCFSQRKGRRRNKKLPSLFKVRREEYLHISSKICTCIGTIDFPTSTWFNHTNQNWLNFCVQRGFFIFFLITFKQLLCFTHGYKIDW